MSKEFFIYNEQTLTYEKVNQSFSQRLLKIGIYIVSVLVTSSIFFLVVDHYVDTPSELALKTEFKQIEYQFSQLGDQVSVMDKVINNIQQRDAGVYRTLFGMEPLDKDVWNGGIGGSELDIKDIPYTDSDGLLAKTQSSVNKLKRQIYLQSISLDTIEMLAKEREENLASIPSIKPIREDKLKRKLQLLSGFGMRLHPVHKVNKMHKGIDFTAPYNTPIQATGDGVVVRVANKKTGYGKHVVIDHGHGYKTLYGHMKSTSVKVGDKVKKGQHIGKVGSTGTSTAPHCHYEVHYKNRPVNPINYVMDGLTPSEYQDLVIKASIANQSFD